LQSVNQTTMNLLEYFTQEKPIRNPKVLLERSEVFIGTTIKIANGTTLTQVWIIDGIAKNIWGTLYVKKNDSNVLYTTDSDGNAKKQSVFNLNFDL
jgi:hypothetical protein